MNLLHIGDNRLSRNIGCRGTNIALRRILGQSFGRISAGLRWSNPLEGAESDTAMNERLMAAQYPGDYAMLLNRIKESDLVVINVEGIFLFTSPIRPDLAYLLIVCHLCLKFHKPFFVVNAGISPPIIRDGTGLRFGEPASQILNETLHYLRLASLVAVRDPLSYDFVRQYDESLPLLYVPDALFSLYDYFEEHAGEFDALLKAPQFVLCHDRAESLIPKFDFDKDYVLLSGSAFATRYGGDNKADNFSELAVALKGLLADYNADLYLLEACDGDAAFRFEVPERTGLPYIPVTTNIFLLGRILGRSRCLVSGRFHPSIFASLGGSSLVLMGSDSHKIQALPKILQFPESMHQIYPSVPDTRQISEIVAAVRRVFEESRDRKDIQRVCRENAHKAGQLAQLIEERL